MVKYLRVPIRSDDEEGIRCFFKGNVDGNKLNLNLYGGNGELRGAATKHRCFRFNSEVWANAVINTAYGETMKFIVTKRLL
jgi:hypothetical protein